MKFTLLSFLVLLFAGMTFAHPDSDSHITAIPVGSSLTIINKDLNFVPNSMDYIIYGGARFGPTDYQIEMNLHSRGMSWCEFRLKSISEDDREIPVEQTYVLTRTPKYRFRAFGSFSVHEVTFNFESDTIRNLTCFIPAQAPDWRQSIGAFRSVISGALRLELNASIKVK